MEKETRERKAIQLCRVSLTFIILHLFDLLTQALKHMENSPWYIVCSLLNSSSSLTSSFASKHDVRSFSSSSLWKSPFLGTRYKQGHEYIQNIHTTKGFTTLRCIHTNRLKVWLAKVSSLSASYMESKDKSSSLNGTLPKINSLHLGL